MNIKPVNYRKPELICQDNQKWKRYSDKTKFINDYKICIEEYFKNLGFKLRLGTNNDILNLDKHCRDCYAIYGDEAANAVTSYDIYRFIEFGNTLVLEDSHDTLLGCIFEVGYDTKDKCSYVMRLAILPNQQDKNLGYLLFEYCCLLAMERGSHVMRGLMKTDTISLCHIVLNKMGWVCDGFENGDSYGVGDGFTISIPLTPSGFTSNRIDLNKTVEFIHNNKEGIDYILVDYDDIEKIKKMYEENSFWIVAVLRKGLVSEKAQFFAMPVETLQIN